MIRSLFFMILTGTGALLLSALFFHGHSLDRKMNDKRELVRILSLTDLALFSEARYTRHPSQADLFSAFQDFPGVFEHFPSGSLVMPTPIGMTRRIKIIKERQP